MKTSAFAGIILAAIPLMGLQLAAADVLLLSGGATLEGQLVKDEADEQEIVFNTGKEFSVKRHDIKEIKLDSVSRLEFMRRLEGIKAGDAQAHFELSRWAQAQHLYTFARQELEATLALQPQHEQARKALERLRNDGQPASKPIDVAVQNEQAGNGNPGASKYWQDRNAYYQEVGEACSTLAPNAAADEKSRQNALLVLKKDRTRATEGILAALDFRNTYDVPKRLGALKALEALQTVHSTVSAYLAMAAVADPDENVRKAVVSLVKARADNAAIGGMLQYLMNDFDGNGHVVDEAVRDRAVESIHSLHEDKQIYQSLLYYVTLEMRVSNTELANLQTRQIDSFQNIGGRIVPLSFPVQLPELKITSVHTTVRCPAVNALEALSGQDFGEDADKWGRWIRKVASDK